MKIATLILLLSIISFSCEKELSYSNGPVNSLPTLTTTVVTTVTNTTAISGGNISSDGGASITVRGVCWGTSTNPVISGNHTTDGTGTGSFSSNITGLTASTLYYVRAYATNVNGTAYGNEISFTTSVTTGALPTVTTAAISAITQTSASGGGNVLTDGGSAVTARGICWSTSSNPVVTNSHTTDGTGLGNFTSSMTALTASTTYFVRAYATNTNGTAYGNELTFTTVAAPGLPSVTTDVISYVASTSAAGGGNVLSDGGFPVTARGICWSTTPAPVVTGSHTTNGSGLGTFGSTLSSLTPATTYYVRAYATNVNGTAYGNERTFTTPATTTDVYACGYEYNVAGKSVAKYWKNGVGIDLTDGTKDADATSIFVVGTDVYVCGEENYSGSNGQAILWKNSVRTNLSSAGSDAYASSVFVSGTDVYVCGSETDAGGNARAKYWKNSVSVFLPDGGSTLINSHANGVVVSGPNVYAAGTIYQTAPATPAKPVIWTNGVESDLATPINDYAVSDGITMSGSDVYAVGFSSDFVNETVKYWKNGVATNMPTAPMETRSGGIAVDGPDVYICGWQTVSSTLMRAKLWKNGVASNLTDGAHDATAYCIKVFGSAVYVGGYEANSSGIEIAKYWKNGVATSLTSGANDAEVYSIFIQ